MNKRTLRVVGLLSAVCILSAIVIGYRLYNKPHRSAENEMAIAVSAASLAAEYGKDEAAANKKYLGQAVQVNGTVSDVSVNQQHKSVVILTGSDMSGVQCSLLSENPGIKKGDSLTLKGFCAGYLADVILDRCIIIH